MSWKYGSKQSCSLQQQGLNFSPSLADTLGGLFFSHVDPRDQPSHPVSQHNVSVSHSKLEGDSWMTKHVLGGNLKQPDTSQDCLLSLRPILDREAAT